MIRGVSLPRPWRLPGPNGGRWALVFWLGLLMLLGVLDYVIGVRSEAMRVTRVAIEQSSGVRWRLGAPVTVRLRPLFGYSHRSGYGNSEASLALIVAGPKGRQSLSVSLRQVEGKWEIRQAEWGDGELLRDLNRYMPLPCFVKGDAGKVFVGSGQCLGGLPSQTLHGFWVSGHEYSAFYPERASIPDDVDLAATGLMFSEEAAETLRKRWKPTGEREIFEIMFIGKRVEMQGLHGTGLSPRGVWVEQILEIEEVE